MPTWLLLALDLVDHRLLGHRWAPLCWWLALRPEWDRLAPGVLERHAQRLGEPPV